MHSNLFILSREQQQLQRCRMRHSYKQLYKRQRGNLSCAPQKIRNCWRVITVKAAKTCVKFKPARAANLAVVSKEAKRGGISPPHTVQPLFCRPLFFPLSHSPSIHPAFVPHTLLRLQSRRPPRRCQQRADVANGARIVNFFYASLGKQVVFVVLHYCSSMYEGIKP